GFLLLVPALAPGGGGAVRRRLLPRLRAALHAPVHEPEPRRAARLPSLRRFAPAAGNRLLRPAAEDPMFRVVRLGTPRRSGEGLRIGTVRHPPRGVRKVDIAQRDFYDVWLPEIAPSAALVRFALSEPWTDARWASYTRRYTAEMKAPPAHRLLALLAALSRQTEFAI